MGQDYGVARKLQKGAGVDPTVGTLRHWSDVAFVALSVAIRSPSQQRVGAIVKEP